MTPEERLAIAAAAVKTDADIAAIATAAAKEAIKELFLTLGVDATDPQQIIEMQRDFAHLRGWRQSIELVKSKGLGAAVIFIVTGGLGIVVYLIKGH